MDVNIIKQRLLLYNYLTTMAPISKKLFDEIIPFFYSNCIKSGNYLVKQGEEVSDIFFITKGLVRSYYLLSNGNERNKCFYSENTVVSPLYSLSTGNKSNLNIICIEDTYFLKVNFNKIREFSDNHLNLQICARKIAENEFISKDKREFQFLTMNSQERYEEFMKSNSDISKRISDNQIASYLGIRRETLSRIKKGLLQKNQSW